MSGPQRGRRYLAVDFWRGIALLTIFVDHVPGNVFERLTQRNFGFSDATEIFVLLAGTAAAFAYMPRFANGEALGGAFRILQRAFQIYMAHIVLVVCCAAILTSAVTMTGDVRFLEAIHLDVLVDNTVPALVGLTTLTMQPDYLNILPLYIVVLAMAPALIWLTLNHPLRGLLASGGLYVATQFLWLNLPTYPLPGTWFFNPFAWQLLFTIGLVIGQSMKQGRTLPTNPILLALAGAYLLAALLWVQSSFYFTRDFSPVPHFIWAFDKTNLSLPRLLHALALVYVVSRLPMEKWLADNRFTAPFIFLGRHSLPVFCVGTVLALTFQMFRAIVGASLPIDTLLIGAGLLAQFAVAGVLEWHRIGTSRKPAIA